MKFYSVESLPRLKLLYWNKIAALATGTPFWKSSNCCSFNCVEVEVTYIEVAYGFLCNLISDNGVPFIFDKPGDRDSIGYSIARVSKLLFIIFL